MRSPWRRGSHRRACGIPGLVHDSRTLRGWKKSRRFMLAERWIGH
jgi:hypothetical protein